MAGTKAGGKQTRDTNIARHGSDYYAKIGKLGGQTPTKKPKGFAANRELASMAGAKGGRISRRKRASDYL